MTEQPPMASSTSTTPSGAPEVWSYRGYHLRSSEFTTAMVHYYRAEIQRSNVWRSRLDATTNWAVLSTSAGITFTLSSPQNHYGVLVLNVLLISIFLWIEARRYRYYELWSLRARLLETDFFAAMLVPPFAPQSGWAESLAQSLLQPEFPISVWEALGRRLRRNYVWMYGVLAIAWTLKLYLHPTTASSLDEMLQRCAIGSIPGPWMVGLGMFFYLGMALLAVLTVGLVQSSGEVLPRFITDARLSGLTAIADRMRAPTRRRRQELLVWIITDQPEKIGQCVLQKMQRGVTRLEGQGMYTGKAHAVLMVALTVTEVAELKAIVRQQDKAAFVIVAPAQEIMGRPAQSQAP